MFSLSREGLPMTSCVRHRDGEKGDIVAGVPYVIAKGRQLHLVCGLDVLYGLYEHSALRPPAPEHQEDGRANVYQTCARFCATKEHYLVSPSFFAGQVTESSTYLRESRRKGSAIGRVDRIL